MPESGTGKASRRKLWVGDFPDGSQLMVEHWPDGAVTAAVKPSRDMARERGWSDSIWGPPITLRREE